MEEKIKKKLANVKAKGHQRLTVLVIPHGFDKSIHFQISIFTVFFLIGMVLSLISIAVYGIVKSNYTKRQINSLSKVYGKYFEDYVNYSEQLDDAQYEFYQLNENLQDIYLIINESNEELNKLPTESDAESIARSELLKEKLQENNIADGRDYLSEIYGYRSLHVFADKNKTLIDSIGNFFENRYTVMNSIPLGSPLSSYNLTSKFGTRRSPITNYIEYHAGIDMANMTGTPIFATASGKVVRVSHSKNGYGNHAVVQHANGYYSLYAHCSKLFVSGGQNIRKGTLIGLVGATGNVTGPHLHYEVWIGDLNRTNPIDYLYVGNY